MKSREETNITYEHIDKNLQKTAAIQIDQNIILYDQVVIYPRNVRMP